MGLMRYIKKIFLALFVLIGFSVSGQVLQTPTVYGYAFRRVGGDTLLFIPGDTLQVPATYNSKTFVARKGTTLYYWNGTKWTAISGAGGGSTDTTSLSNRINLKLNISDTAAMLSPYVRSNIYTANGTLTANRTLNASGYRMKFDNLQWMDFEFSPNTNSYFRLDPQFTNFYLWDTVAGGAAYQDLVANPGEVFVQIGARNKADFFVGSNASQNAGFVQLINVKTSGSEEQRIDMDSSGIRFRPFRGSVNVDSLVTSTSLTGRKIVVHDTTTGEITRVDASLIGGGTYTAGNGLTLSGSEFRLGGVLSANTMIGGGGGARWIMFDTVANFIAKVRNGSNSSDVGIYSDDASINYYAGTDRQNVIQATNIGSYLGSGTTSTRFALVSTIRSDSSVRLRSLSKKFFIDTLQSGGGETMVYNRSTNAVSFRIDTLTLATFGAGSGASGDTAAFTTDALYGSLYIDVDTFIVTKIVAVIQAGATDTLGIQIYYNDSLNTGTTGVATSTLALTSRPQGHSTTTLSNATIPPGSFIWCKSPTVVAGRKPEYLSVSLIGYRKRRS